LKTHRVCIEIVVIGAAIAVGIALLIASLGFVAAAAAEQVRTYRVVDHEYEGMVTCSRCGAKHSSALAKNASVCVRICVHDGATFALVDANSIYLLDGDLIAIKKFAGERAHVVGVLTGNTIKVSSIISQSQAYSE